MKTMKKYIFMAVAGMLALSSCSNDNDEQILENTPRQMTFTAGYGDGAQTRASLSGKAVSFDANDEISILSTNNTNTKFTTTAGGASATFTGSATDDTKFYAVYPYQTGLTLDSNTGVISGITIPVDQSAAATSTCGWAPAAALAFATTSGTSLTFKNLCALLKVTNDKSTAVDIEIYSSDDYHPFTGIFQINTNTGKLEYDQSYDDPMKVSVSGVPSGKTIYIAVAPGHQLSMEAYWMSGGIWKFRKKEASFDLEAGKIYDLGKTSEWTTEI